jgi:hypothetical protein
VHSARRRVIFVVMELVDDGQVTVYLAFGDMRALLHCIVESTYPCAKLVCIPSKPSKQICGNRLLLWGDRNVACPDDALQIETFSGTSIKRHATLGSRLYCRVHGYSLSSLDDMSSSSSDEPSESAAPFCCDLSLL